MPEIWTKLGQRRFRFVQVSPWTDLDNGLSHEMEKLAYKPLHNRDSRQFGFGHALDILGQAWTTRTLGHLDTHSFRGVSNVSKQFFTAFAT